MSLWKGREFRESKVVEVVSGRRSFVEVAGLSKSSENENLGGPVQTHHQKRPAITKLSENEMVGGRVKTHHQTRLAISPVKIHAQIGTTQAIAKVGVISVVRRRRIR
jgi:hypothetical protein